jgi:3-oxoacyl-[acyl-carrier protein] reductase
VEEFSGKVAVVAGGARGIGRAAARKLALEDAAVVICSDQQDQLSEALAELREREGLELSATQADVTSSEDMKGLMDLAAETYGGLDVLVNSVGI